jgi:hypothetical protein
VTNAILFGCPLLFLLIGTVNCVQTLKVKDRGNAVAEIELREVKIVDTTAPTIKVDIPNGEWVVERAADYTAELVKIMEFVTARYSRV